MTTKSDESARNARSRKGIAMESLGYLILGVIGVILLAIFVINLFPAMERAIVEVVQGLKCKACEGLGWLDFLGGGGLCEGC